jgi:tetratricopeptide (TPR) repeat protein
MQRLRHRRLFFALALAVVLVMAPAQERAAPQSPPAATTLPNPDARKAKQAYEKGLRAEQAGDWPAAFQAYAQATSYAPGDTQALLRREAARFRMVEQHTDRAEREALAGRLEQARIELRAALKIDPGYSVAQERLAQLEAPAPEPQQPPPSPAGPVDLQPQAGTRDFDFRGDVRGAYETVARAFGLVAAYDADLPARSIRFRVRGLSFPTAMALLGQQTNTFWRALDAKTFFVAENTSQKRSEYAAVVVRTFTLPASTTPDRMTETMRLVREIAGVTHTELDTRSRTLTIRDSPRNVALAGALIRQIEQAPGELMLEIEILEVNQNAARRLGITPPSTARVLTLSPQDIRQAQQSTQGLLRVIQRLFGLPTTLAGLNPTQGATTGGPVGLGALVPPLVAFGGGKTIFLATLPGAAADFSDALTLVRSGRRMLLRAQDGQPATFFVGERFPVALAVLGASFVPSQFTPGSNQPIFPRSDFTTAGSPIAVLTGRFTPSGRVDLAVANQAVAGQSQTTNSISILPGSGDGSFGLRTDTPLGAVPVALATGDFNGDGHADLAVVTRSPDGVTILLGQPDGSFQTGQTLTTGAGPIAIATGDFNVDGHTDLAVVNKTDGTVSIFLNKGDTSGTFNAGQTLTAGAGPVALVAADFNGDSHTDLAVVNNTDGTVSIFLNKGDTSGTFNTGQTLTTGAGPAGVATADFNGDGKLDLAVVNQGDNTVSILLGKGDVLGKGDGSFNPRSDFNVGKSPVGVAAADFNTDGKFDVAVANQGSNTVSVLLGAGDGNFNFRIDLVTGTGPVAIAANDFNGDGRPDLVLADETANAVSVILNTGVPFLASPGIPQVPYPGAEYEDLGLKVRATPRMHADEEVTLQMEFEIRSLSGVTFNGIPVISNRTLQQTVRLHENESTVLAGILQQQETRTITGLPGFAHAAGHLAGRRDTQRQDTELLIVITPRQLRLAPRSDRSIYAGPGSGMPGGPERARVQQ